METSSVVSKIKGCFGVTLPARDPRAKIQPIDFITSLVCSFGTKDGRVKSISSLRKSVIEITRETISRGSFWERLATKKLMRFTQLLLSALMSELCVQLGVGASILPALGVIRIFLLDASSFTLPEGARETFPAPRSNVIASALKVHVLYDLFGGLVAWFDITPGTTHDRKGFPPLDLLVGALIIFDLGYWDYQLLKDMIVLNIFFLSRVKSGAKIKVVKVVSCVSKTCIGFDLHSGRLSGFRGKIVEVIGQFIVPKTKEAFECRIVGFWNPNRSEYHWYATNLKVSSVLIYPLYRLRWQLELVWKAWKSFLHLDEIKSSNRNIIITLTLIGMCVGMISEAISISTLNSHAAEKQAAFSVQRAASLFLRIGKHLFQFICRMGRGVKQSLLETIKIFEHELYDPNYKKRNSSVRLLLAEICGTS